MKQSMSRGKRNPFAAALTESSSESVLLTWSRSDYHSSLASVAESHTVRNTASSPTNELFSNQAALTTNNDRARSSRVDEDSESLTLQETNIPLRGNRGGSHHHHGHSNVRSSCLTDYIHSSAVSDDHKHSSSYPTTTISQQALSPRRSSDASALHRMSDLQPLDSRRSFLSKNRRSGALLGSRKDCRQLQTVEFADCENDRSGKQIPVGDTSSNQPGTFTRRHCDRAISHVSSSPYPSTNTQSPNSEKRRKRVTERLSCKRRSHKLMTKEFCSNLSSDGSGKHLRVSVDSRLPFQDKPELDDQKAIKYDRKIAEQHASKSVTFAEKIHVQEKQRPYHSGSSENFHSMKRIVKKSMEGPQDRNYSDLLEFNHGLHKSERNLASKKANVKSDTDTHQRSHEATLRIRNRRNELLKNQKLRPKEPVGNTRKVKQSYYRQFQSKTHLVNRNSPCATTTVQQHQSNTADEKMPSRVIPVAKIDDCKESQSNRIVKQTDLIPGLFQTVAYSQMKYWQLRTIIRDVLVRHGDIPVDECSKDIDNAISNYAIHLMFKDTSPKECMDVKCAGKEQLNPAICQVNEKEVKDENGEVIGSCCRNVYRNTVPDEDSSVAEHLQRFEGEAQPKILLQETNHSCTPDNTSTADARDMLEDVTSDATDILNDSSHQFKDAERPPEGECQERCQYGDSDLHRLVDRSYLMLTETNENLTNLGNLIDSIRLALNTKSKSSEGASEMSVSTEQSAKTTAEMNQNAAGMVSDAKVEELVLPKLDVSLDASTMWQEATHLMETSLSSIDVSLDYKTMWQEIMANVAQTKSVYPIQKDLESSDLMSRWWTCPTSPLTSDASLDDSKWSSELLPKSSSISDSILVNSSSSSSSQTSLLTPVATDHDRDGLPGFRLQLHSPALTSTALENLKRVANTLERLALELSFKLDILTTEEFPSPRKPSQTLSDELDLSSTSDIKQV